MSSYTYQLGSSCPENILLPLIPTSYLNDYLSSIPVINASLEHPAAPEGVVVVPPYDCLECHQYRNNI